MADPGPSSTQGGIEEGIQARSGTSSSTTHCPGAILCVDGNETNRYVRTRLLRSHGFRVIEAAKGADAIRLAVDEQPSLVLMDIGLPDINGFVVCRRLKSNPKTAAIPVLHISNLGKLEHEYPEALESGAEAYLQEPVEPSVLISVITALIRAASAEARARKSERDAVDILESVAEAIFMLDDHYRFTYVNAEAERVLGIERSELIGKTYSEAFPRSVGTIVYSRVMSERVLSVFEGYYEPWDRWFEIKACPVSSGGVVVRFRDTTQRKQAEDERQSLLRNLAEKTGELQAVLDAAPVAVFIAHDPECREITGNSMAYQLYEAHSVENVAPDASMGRRFFQDGKEIQTAELPMQRAAATGADVRGCEIEVHFPSGRHVHVLGNAGPLRDSAGQVRGCVGAFMDITQRKQAEQALRESEERFRLLADGCPAIIWVSDASGGNRFVNRAYREFFGVEFEQVEGRGWRPLVHPDDEPEYVGAVLNAVRQRTAIESEARVRRADGEWRWLASYGEPRFSPSGEFVGHAGISTDITERKKAEEALAEAVQRTSAHIDNSPLAVIEFDRDFRVIRWSKEAEKLFGWRAEEISGRAIPDMKWVHEDDAEVVRRVSQDMLDGTRPRNVCANRNYRKDGSVVECEWYNSAIYNAQGELTSILSQVLDLTGRKRAEAQLREAQKMESIALLAGGVAHDFNNLLVGIIGNASLAMEVLHPDNSAQEYLERVVKSGEQAAHLTKQMLAYSGKGRFMIEPVDLSGLVREVVDLVRSTAPKKIAMQLDLQPGLPPVVADRGQVHQVLMNLVINATEAVGDETGLIAVQTGLRNIDDQFILGLEGWDLKPGVYVFLEVRDTGCGMDQATLAKIFDPFFTTKFQGRGLGLAAVAGIVRGHHGAVQVRTAPGRGASFLVLFPAMEEQDERVKPSAQGASEQRIRHDCIILVVDDEELVRHTAKAALERRGCTVIVANSGSEALTLLRTNAGRISLAILDLSMPGMSGQEVLPKMLEIDPQLTVVVSSGYSESDALQRFEGMPIAGFIQKPYTVQSLVEKVKSALDRKRN